MTDILYPTKTRRFMSEVAGVRRYHRDPARASCNPDRVANFIAIVSGQGRES